MLKKPCEKITLAKSHTSDTHCTKHKRRFGRISSGIHDMSQVMEDLKARSVNEGIIQMSHMALTYSSHAETFGWHIKQRGLGGMFSLGSTSVTYEQSQFDWPHQGLS